MKRTYIMQSFLFVGIAVLMSSCALFNKSVSNKIEPVLPDDREAISVKKEKDSFTPEEINHGVVKGDWSIETVYGKPAVGEKAPFIKFVPSEKRMYGNNGCNVINAEYSYNAQDSTIRFNNIACTMMMCAMEGLTDYEINTALGSAKYYTWNVEESDYFLTFFDETGREVMKLLHQNFEFLNGTWKISKINGQPVSTDGLRMVIDVAEGKIHCDTGCNIMNGVLEVDMEHPNSISFSGILTTLMSCPDNRSETELIVAIEEVSSARPVSGREVELYNDRHKSVLTLIRATDK